MLHGVGLVVPRLQYRLESVWLSHASWAWLVATRGQEGVFSPPWLRFSESFSPSSEAVHLATAKTEGFDWGVLILLLGLKNPGCSEALALPLRVRMIATFEIRKDFYPMFRLAWIVGVFFALLYSGRGVAHFLGHPGHILTDYFLS